MARVEAEVGKRAEGVWGGLVKWIDDRFPMTETSPDAFGAFADFCFYSGHYAAPVS